MPTDITGIHEKLIKYDGRLQYEVWHKMMRSAKNGQRLQGGGECVVYDQFTSYPGYLSSWGYHLSWWVRLRLGHQFQILQGVMGSVGVSLIHCWTRAMTHRDRHGWQLDQTLVHTWMYKWHMFMKWKYKYSMNLLKCTGLNQSYHCVCASSDITWPSNSFFHPRQNGQWPPTSKDFYTRSYPLHYFLILILEKEPVFPFSMLSAIQRKYLVPFL